MNNRQSDRQKELGELFRTYYAPMVLYATRLFGNVTDAEDVVQDVFSQMLLSGQPLTVFGRVKAYLFTVLHNKIIDALRYQQRHRREALIDVHVGDSLEEAIFELDVYARLYEEIEKLPVKNAHVLQLKLQGKSDREIAALLDIKYETVRSHVKHGIASLRGKLSTY